jgi:hypothetical protein
MGASTAGLPRQRRHDEVHLAAAYHGLTALIAVVGLVVGMASVTGAPNYTEAPVQTWLDFTAAAGVQAAALVFVVNLTLLMDSAMPGGRVWRAARTAGLAAMLLVFLAQFTPLRGLPGAAASAPAGTLANSILHFTLPVVVIVGWLFFGPRPRIQPKAVLLSLVFPAFWLLWSAATGRFEGSFPFGAVLAPGTVLMLAIGLVLVWLGATMVFMLLDASLRPDPEHPTAGPGHEEAIPGTAAAGLPFAVDLREQNPVDPRDL